MDNLNQSNDDSKIGPLFQSWSYSKINYILFGIGLTLVISGYFVMNKGPEGVDSFESLTLAPMMLFFGYIFFIPAALIYRAKKTAKK
tara:strand:+ start:161748 stop:162008 length:261 start_codon:yes stop_codon:yes gene_type:complete